MSSEEIIEGVEQYLYSDGQADNILLIEGLTLVSKVATTLLSILTGIIIIGLPLIVAVEIIYINFPVVQRPINTKIIYKTGRIHRILAFALRDAVRAVEECEIEPSKNVNFEYLKLKIRVRSSEYGSFSLETPPAPQASTVSVSSIVKILYAQTKPGFAQPVFSRLPAMRLWR